MSSKPRIVAIDGAVRSESATRQLIKISERYFEDAGAEYIPFYQDETSLPIFNGLEETANQPIVKEYLELVGSADGFVLSSPEYHGSMSGAIKNALDWLNFLPPEGKVKGKVFGIMGGGGALANSGATLQLMMAIRSLHGWLMPDVLMSVPTIWSAFNEEGTDLQDEGLKKRLRQFSTELSRYTKLFKELL